MINCTMSFESRKCNGQGLSIKTIEFNVEKELIDIKNRKLKSVIIH